jgi:peptidoglycan/LPS O-acetylase OafA/YrhL
VRRRPELDGLRGIAVLAVLCAHSGVPGFADGGGGAGVTLFFVLSGYLITGLLRDEFEACGRVDLQTFYVRRALRLFPALAAAIVVSLALIGARAAPTSAVDGVDYGLVVGSVAAYVVNWLAVAGHSLGMLGHAWSLAVEEQFYLAWPAVLLLGMRYGRGVLLGLILMLVLADIPYRLWLDLNGAFMHVFVGTDSRGDALLLGSALALLRVQWHAAFGWLGLAGILGLAVVWPGDPGLGVQIILIPAAAIAGTLAVAGCPRQLAWAPLAFIGRISYGLYLWHGLVVWWHMPWALSVGASLLIAVVSYHALERPFLRLKERFPRRAEAPG